MKTWIILNIIICVILEASQACAYTGLIIDAHGLGVYPAMSPKIYDEEGIEIYGTVEVSPDFVNTNGILGYANTIKQAIEEGLVGDNPLIIRALRLDSHPVKGNLIVSRNDGKLVLTENMISGFLYDYKVAIVW